MTEEPLLDIALLDESFDFDADGTRELIDMYLVQAKEILADLRAAIQASQPDSVSQLAHKLTGSSVVCGVTAMVGPLRMLEMRGRVGELSDADPLVATAAERLESCRRLLDEYLATKSG